MNGPFSLTLAIAVFAALVGVALALYGTLRAAQAQTPSQAFISMVLAGAGYVLLALGAAVRAPDSDGLRAAVLQAAVLLMAAALGALSLGPPGKDTSGSGRQLALAALFVAWLSLFGLPPTAGFHARILVYRSLLQAGWSSALTVALMLNAAGLVPAFSALALGCQGSLRGGRALLAVILLIGLVLVGIYPGFGVAAADFMARSR